MDVQKHIRAFVMADPEIAAQIGTRFYPVKLPQTATFPALTLQRISGVRFQPLKGPASLARPRYQFDVWMKVADGVAAFSRTQMIGQLLRERLEGQRTDVLDDSVMPAVIRRMWFEFDTDRDLFEPDVNGGYYRYSADYFIWHQT